MKLRSRMVLTAMTIIAITVFWLTAFPTITWWDSSSYSLAAATLGITAAPGSLILTMLGWPITKLPFVTSSAHALNLLAGVLAALAAGLIYTAVIRLNTMATDNHPQQPSSSAIIGAALGALGFVFSATVWQYSVMFTPYILTVVFTALILLAMLKWWSIADDANAWHWLLLLGVLFGLDFSVHRTNVLLIPGAMLWVLLRRPKTFLELRTVLASTMGLIAGLLVQLLLIPISRSTTSPLNMWHPDTPQRLWDYVSLKQVGGNFLVKLWPRNSAFWSNQVGDVLQTLKLNLLSTQSHFGLLGVLSLVMVFMGVMALLRRQRRLAIAMVVVFLVQAILTVVYFNIPAGFFRSLNRHYLPLLVTLGVLGGYGCVMVSARVSQLLTEGRRGSAAFGMVVLALVPMAQLVGNFAESDASERYFTGDYARNALIGLPQHAIYFTMGDNDTFPVLYAQAVEGVRPDVSIVNISLTNAPFYLEQLKRNETTMPLSFSAEERNIALNRDWTDSVHIGPMNAKLAPMFEGTTVLSDVALLEILMTNNWQRPVTFGVTVGRAVGWLSPFVRLDGTYSTVIPEGPVTPDLGILRTNLLSKYQYRGYATKGLALDPVSVQMGAGYYYAFGALLDGIRAEDGVEACELVRDRFTALLPLERLNMQAETRARLSEICGGELR